ncbi:exo-beta-1,3-glucanase [Paramagnetospirillum kuznetsovii]|uniref:Endo-1,3-beta-glucanase btgC n=1 Tax=Paramagnetospirillum kuznetsovii TaxID=2053833 RepID=A0A364NZJ3_9PROT|nr:exo-beta-1,3-glucanase [Paramagnetospirillum kuznetsovii]RAU22501.1 exo-beta-1,3-glucanase [Paramagnetospirillum kuznetsovii]
MSKIFAYVVVAVMAAVNVAGWWWFNRPIPVELSFNEPFPSVSFAPFRRGQGPITKVFPPPEQIVEDLRSLVGVTKGVRTYTSLEGMDIVPKAAGELGLEVTHSAWLGQKRANNDMEIAALIKSANQYPDTIKRVIVGNEVLLRQDLPVDELIGHIREVKAKVKQPVTYADVWAFWLKNPQLAKEVDFITIHILPYWEDEPIGVEHAERHILMITRMVAQAFPGKPILIGEAGWPTRGRSRGPAVANMENAAIFVRTLARVSKENGFDYNVVEAFDQPWKAKLEGTVGAKWGVVDEDRHVKFAMSGPVEPSPLWPMHAMVSTVLGVVAGLWFLRRPERYDAKAGLAVAVIAQLMGALVIWQVINAQALAYDALEDYWAYARVTAHGALAVLLVKAAGQGFARDGVPLASKTGEWLVALYGFCAISISLLLLLNGRYRDIPPMEFLAPCVGVTVYALARMAVLGLDWKQAFAISKLFGGCFPGGVCPTGKILAGLIVSVVISPLSEVVALARGEDFVASHPKLSDQLPMLTGALWENREMCVWTVMVAVMGLPFLAEWLLSRRGES